MRILVATAGTDHSDTAILLGVQIAARLDAALTLLTVVRRESEREQADAILTRAGALVNGRLPNLQREIRIGQTAAEIDSVARAGRYDLLIVGDKSSHRLMDRLISSTAERLIGLMPCPILIARKGAQLPDKLLLCEGGREPSLLERLLTCLKPLVATASALTILHVMSQVTAAPGVSGWELRAGADELMAQHTHEGELLEKGFEKLSQLSVELAVKVRHGLVVDEVLSEAADGDYDLVVIGAHIGSGWQRFLLDDLARQIVTGCDTSILII